VAAEAPPTAGSTGRRGPAYLALLARGAWCGTRKDILPTVNHFLILLSSEFHKCVVKGVQFAGALIMLLLTLSVIRKVCDMRQSKTSSPNLKSVCASPYFI